jgi:UDP-glucose 4-epimerase
MKFVVTGGAGFIGSHIAKQLVGLKRGEVYVIDNLSVGDRTNVPPGARFCRGDIRDKGSFEHVLDGAEMVFHNAAFVSIRGSFSMIRHDIEVNDIGTLNVLEACRDHGVSKVIFASSMAVYAPSGNQPIKESSLTLPVSPYGFSKLKGEFYCRLFREQFGLKTVILRYFNTYGVGQTPSDYVGVITIFINQALNNKPVTIFGNGEQTRDFVFVEDVASANIEAAFRDVEGTFNIAGGREVNINGIADYVMEATGFDKRAYVDAPPGEIRRMVADISRTKEQLGIEPEVNLKKRVFEIAGWWKNRQGRQEYYLKQ